MVHKHFNFNIGVAETWCRALRDRSYHTRMILLAQLEKRPWASFRWWSCWAFRRVPTVNRNKKVQRETQSVMLHLHVALSSLMRATCFDTLPDWWRNSGKLSTNLCMSSIESICLFILDTACEKRIKSLMKFVDASDMAKSQCEQDTEQKFDRPRSSPENHQQASWQQDPSPLEQYREDEWLTRFEVIGININVYVSHRSWHTCFAERTHRNSMRWPSAATGKTVEVDSESYE